jgi:hypothetical protein
MIEKVKKYLGYIIAFLLLLFIAVTCINRTANKYIGEGNIYEKQLKNKVILLKKDSIRAATIVDSLHKTNKERESLILNLKKKNTDLEIKVSAVYKKKEQTLKKVKSFTNKQNADFIASSFNKPESITYDSTGVTLKDDLPNQVVKVIIEKEACEEEAVYNKQMLSNAEKEKDILNENLESKDEEIKVINAFSKEQSSTLEASQLANESFKKQNRTLRTGRTIERVLVVAGVITTILILKK